MKKSFFIFLISILFLVACQPNTPFSPQLSFKVLAIETFLADIAQNVAGDHFQVSSLIPAGIDPHSFELVPQDVIKLASSNLIITNGGGLESWLQETLISNAIDIPIIDASKGLTNRSPKPNEITSSNQHSTSGGNIDPHFWLDPTMVITYTQNIRDAFSLMDPKNIKFYENNASNYIDQLISLDTWVHNQVDAIPPENRLLITNHETLGYFADRYGFTIIGAIIPSTSTNASPSAQHIADLISTIRSHDVKAIFLEIGSNAELAQQVASETSITIVEDLYTHSLSTPDGPATNYLDMIKYDTNQIVDALK